MSFNIQINHEYLAEKQLQEQLVQAKQDYEQGITNLIGEVPHIEIASWTKQEVEARSLVQDDTTITPFLDLLVTSRGMGETRSELANKVIANADAYTVGYAQVLGKYQAKIKEINGL